MNRLLFKKEGRAKYISHLDLMRTMQRVFVRAGISIKHTSGFNPHPYMAFALPLSVGTESLCELMDFELLGNTPSDRLPELLNAKMPEGVTVLSTYESERKFKDIKWLDAECRLVYDQGVPASCIDRLSGLFGADSLIIEKRTKRGTAETDIIPMIDSIKISHISENELLLSALVSAQDPSLPPAQLLSAIKQRLPELSPDFYTLKRIEIFDSDHKVFR